MAAVERQVVGAPDFGEPVSREADGLMDRDMSMGMDPRRPKPKSRAAGSGRQPLFGLPNALLAHLQMSSYRRKIGAGEGIRTLDPDLGKVVLYP